MDRFKILQAAMMLALIASPAVAKQPAEMSNSIMPMGPNRSSAPTLGTAADANPATKAFRAADDKMMKDMDQLMTGNTDQDFAAAMLPHHAGAVDMAKVEILYGKDPEMLTLARSIIAAQQKEIAQMQQWRKDHLEHR